MNKRVLPMSVFFVAMSMSANGLEGSFKVTVVDQAGNPLQGAYARADRMDGGASLSPVPGCATAATGTCVIEHLHLGQYTVNAGKPDSNFPPMYIPFYRRGEPPKFVRLTSAKPTIEVFITLGPKAGVVEFSIVDSATGD